MKLVNILVPLDVVLLFIFAISDIIPLLKKTPFKQIRILLRVVLFGLIFLSVWISVIIFIISLRDHYFGLMFPFDIGITEGREVIKGYMLRFGYSLYPDMRNYPFSVTIYPPLFHFMIYLVSVITGPSMLAGRIVSSVSALFFSLFVGLICLKLSKNRNISFLLFLIFFSSAYMREWGYLARPDMLSLALAFGGFYFGLKNFYDHKSNLPLISILLFIGAFLTKQQVLPIFLLSILMALIFTKSLRFAFIYGLTVFIPVVLIYAVINYHTHGMFYLDVIKYPGLQLRTPGSWAGWYLAANLLKFTGSYYWQIMLFSLLPLIISYKNKLLFSANLLIFIVFYSMFHLSQNADVHRFADIYINVIFLISVLGFVIACLAAILRSKRAIIAYLFLVLSAPFLFILLGVVGTETNYYLSLTAFIYIAMGEIFALLDERGFSLETKYAFVVLFVFITVNPASLSLNQIDAFSNRYISGDFDLKNRINQVIAKTPGNVLVDDEGSYLLVNHKIKLIDSMETGLFEKAGLWDSVNSKIAEDIRARKFPLIVEAQKMNSENLRNIIYAYYYLDQTIGAYSFYRPMDPNINVFPIMDLNFKELVDADIHIAKVKVQNISYSPQNITVLDDKNPGLVEINVKSASPIRKISVVTYPRLENSHAEDNIQAAIIKPSEQVLPLFTFKPIATTGWTGIWENKTENEINLDSKEFLIRFMLYGKSAQLWFDSKKPIYLYLSKSQTDI